jgi:hypothetical protein
VVVSRGLDLDLDLRLETYLVARDQRVDTAGGACCFPAGNAVAYGLCGWCVCQNELHVVERGLHGGTHDGYWLAFILVGPVAADTASFDWHDWRFWSLVRCLFGSFEGHG